jgi:multidrug efflux pump subunit AcrB
LADPIFKGLAISLMASEVTSLLLSRSAVPIFYYKLWKNRKSPIQESLAEDKSPKALAEGLGKRIATFEI